MLRRRREARSISPAAMVETRSGRSVGGEEEEYERSASPRAGRHRDTAGTSAGEEGAGERRRRSGHAHGAGGRGAAAAPAAPPLTDSQAYTLLALLLLLCALPLGFTPKLVSGQAWWEGQGWGGQVEGNEGHCMRVTLSRCGRPRLPCAVPIAQSCAFPPTPCLYAGGAGHLWLCCVPSRGPELPHPRCAWVASLQACPCS